MHFGYGAVTLYRKPFQIIRLYMRFVTPWAVCHQPRQLPQHRQHNTDRF